MFALTPRQIVPLAKPFGELFGEVAPFLGIADRSCSRGDGQHRPPESGAVDGHLEPLGALRMRRQIGLDHLRQLRGRFDLLDCGPGGWPIGMRFNRDLGRLLRHIRIRPAAVRISAEAVRISAWPD